MSEQQPTGGQTPTLGEAIGSVRLDTAVVLLGAAALAVGSVGTWASVGALTVSGTHGTDGRITLAAGVLCVVGLLLRRLSPLVGALTLLGLGTIGLAVGGIDLIRAARAVNGVLLFGVQIAHIGWGLYAVVIGGAAVAFGAGWMTAHIWRKLIPATAALVGAGVIIGSFMVQPSDTGARTDSANRLASRASSRGNPASPTHGARTRRVRATACHDDVVDLGELGTWTLNARGGNCATAHSILMRFENSTFADNTIGTLGNWQCRETRFVPFKADTDHGYEAWRCSRRAAWVTFATGEKSLADSRGSIPSTTTPSGFRSATGSSATPSGAPHMAAGGSYSGVATVSPVGPATDQALCSGESGFTVARGTTSCAFGTAVFRVVKQAHARTGTYPARVMARSSVTDQTYTLSCEGDGNAGSTTEPPTELSCATKDGAEVTILLPLRP